MVKPLVECIANYSDARRPEVVEAIAASIAEVAGVRILDRHSDLDHNRSVISFVGPPEAVEEAAFRSIRKAAELINLEEHRGEHPRIGATDVVPFVPISGISMQDCVAMAKSLGSRVGRELEIPVYLYEEAATRPERQNLENIRRGQYEVLKQEISALPERLPDYGPARLGTAGATVIGARQPLIAFNVYLNTSDVSIANKIARSIRHSSGGLRFLKALGLSVEGLAQVSMNLTNYRSTPLARVVELIRREAARYGTAIHHSELVGLIPEEALVDAAVWYLQLDQFAPEQILERKLYTSNEAQADQDSFLDALASGAATPGGGAAAAFSAASAAALVAMVARLTIGKKKYAAVEAQMQAILAEVEQLRKKLTAAVNEDSAAFEKVMAAYKLPKDTPEQAQTRQASIQKATYEASLVPLDVAQKAARILELAYQVVSEGNINAICDGGSAAELAQAAFESALLNVLINVKTLQDQTLAANLLNEASRLTRQARDQKAAIKKVLTERGGLDLG